MAILSTMFLAACSSNDDSLDQAANPQEEVCILHWDAPAPSFESDNQTRATTDWVNGSKIYIRLKANNSTYLLGATYTSGYWIVDGNVSAVPTTATSATAEIYYFENPGSATSSRVNLNEQSIVYYGTGTYSHPAAAEFYVNVKINPVTWRLRFLGSSSANSISLDGSNTDIEYYTSYDINAGTLTKAQRDVALTTGSNNYTPYIYGVFKNSGNNTLRYTTSNGYFYRTIKSSDLQVAGSGYCQIPTASNYASAGWQYVANSSSSNAKVEPDFLVTFTDGIVTDFKASNDVAYWDYMIYNKNTDSDTEIINSFKEGEKIPAEEAEYVFRMIDSDFFFPNTTYYLYTIAYDKNGNHGELQKITFKTRATTLPLASITSVVPSSQNGTAIWDINMSLTNSATGFYLFASEDNVNYNYDSHLIAWLSYYGIMKDNQDYAYGPIEGEGEGEGSLHLRRSGSVLSIVTWAINSSGTVGNYSAGYYPAKSTARAKEVNYILNNKIGIPKPNLSNYKILKIDNK